MAKVKSGISGGFVKAESKPKKTSDGSGKNTRPSSKNEKRNFKAYRGQGH